MVGFRFAHCRHLKNHTQRFVEENSNVTHFWWRQHSLITNMNMHVTKRVEHSVKMISQEVQFCLFLILAYSEASRCQFLVHRLPTYTYKCFLIAVLITLRGIKGVCLATRPSPLAQNVDYLEPKLSLSFRIVMERERSSPFLFVFFTRYSYTKICHWGEKIWIVVVLFS